jgi:integrase/recombinase XerC/integrase/recombinase XerD
MSRLERFLNLYESPFTKRNYKAALKKFTEAILPSSESLESGIDTYFSRIMKNGQFDLEMVETDILTFSNSLNGAPPKTWRVYISAAKMFLSENKVDLSVGFWKRLSRRRKGHRALTIDKIPSREELVRIVSECPLSGKSIILLLASSGMRIGECLRLRFKDFDFEHRTIQIPGQFTKSGDSRTVFYSQECADVLKEYLDRHEEFLQRSINRSRFAKVKDDRVFPMTVQNVYEIWWRALNRTKLNGRDSTTNRNKLHPHVLRKFFRTMLGPVLPVDVIEALMGHEGYLADVYRKYSIEQLAEFYKQGEQVLTVFTESGSRLRLSKIEEENALLRKQIENLNINGLGKANEIEGLKTELNKMDERLDGITETRKESDTVMDRLFEDPEFRKLVTKKLKQLT